MPVQLPLGRRPDHLHATMTELPTRVQASGSVKLVQKWPMVTGKCKRFFTEVYRTKIEIYRTKKMALSKPSKLIMWTNQSYVRESDSRVSLPFSNHFVGRIISQAYSRFCTRFLSVAKRYCPGTESFLTMGQTQNGGKVKQSQTTGRSCLTQQQILALEPRVQWKRIGLFFFLMFCCRLFF